MERERNFEIEKTPEYFYKHSIEKIIEIITQKYPETKSNEKQGETEEERAAYVLWMCERIKEMERKDVKSAVKAARWIGWIFREMEVLNFWDNNTSRDLSRLDNKDNTDIPTKE